MAADWPVYHGDPARTGLASSFPSLGAGLTQAWSTALDGAVYGEPLGVTGQVIVATENDTVYSLNPTTGSISWHQHLGTPVALSSLPCGNIDPLGITSTPAYDPSTGSVFVVAEVAGPAHTLFALDASTGAVRWSRSVDLAGHDPRTHQQRAALALGNGYVYVGFGGLAGDCGQYQGEVVGVPTTGSGATISYQVPVAREGAVWATGGPVIDSSGNLYVSVGNGSSTTTYDGSDSILELSPKLALLSRFAPAQWASDNATDADLGSLSPVLVPGGWVFIAGKSGIGYVLKQGSLGGIGGEIHSATVCRGFGGAAIEGSTIYLPCSSGLRMIQIGAGGTINAGWQTNSATGPPVVGGGAVWSVSISTGKLFALSEADGSVLASISLGAVPHFDAPTLWDGLVLVGTLSGVVAITASVPSASATYHSLGSSRILDTRAGTGLAGPFTSRVAREFAVAGQGGVDPAATAVTGNLTVTGQTRAGYVSLTTTPQSAPGTSTINFPLGDTRANGVTLGLAGDGGLWATYVSSGSAHVNLVFDVTGYFTPDATGATYHSLTPTRILDTRSSTGLTSMVPLEFPVTGHGGVPAGAIAITANLTVTGQARAGYVSLTSMPQSAPTTSTINVPLGDTRANGVTAQLTGDGQLWATYVASGPVTTNLVFDVTGYFTPDATGATYHSLGSSRILDTRAGTGLAGPFTSRVAREFAVAGQGGVDPAATAVTGNLTVTGQTRAGYVSLTTTPQSAPGTSTINFPLGDTRANGVTLGLAGDGGLWATYVDGSGRTSLVFDVTGFFSP